MDKQTRLFIEQKQIVILVHNVDLPGSRKKIIRRRRLVEKFLLDIQGEDIPRFQPVAAWQRRPFRLMSFCRIYLYIMDTGRFR